MLVHQCDSCSAIAKRWNTNIGRPAGWGIVTVDLPSNLEPGSGLKREYSLCPQCLKTPMTFGTINITGLSV